VHAGESLRFVRGTAGGGESNRRGLGADSPHFQGGAVIEAALITAYDRLIAATIWNTTAIKLTAHVGWFINTSFGENSMRLFAWALMAVCAFTVGCNQPVESIPSVTPTTSGTTGDDHSGHDHAAGEDHDHDAAPVADEGAAPASEDSASTEPAAVRFVADKSLSVPGMMCPYACYPAVKEALAAVPGVEGVQLAKQPADAAEGSIENKVVELKLAEGFDITAAVAALKAANYEAEVVN